MNKLLLIVVISTFLGGCASSSKMNEAYYTSMLEQRKELIKAKIQSSNKSLCKIECPIDGCKIKSFECNAPDDINVPNIQAPVSDAKYWSDALVKTFSIAAPVYLGTMGFKSIENTAIGVSNVLGTPSNTTYTYTNSNNDGSIIGDGQIGDYTGNNIGSGQIGDNTTIDNTDNSDNSTHIGNTP